MKNVNVKKIAAAGLVFLTATAFIVIVQVYGLDLITLYTNNQNSAGELNAAMIMLGSNQQADRRFPVLRIAAISAVRLGKYGEAQEFATELLNIAPNFPHYNGDALFDGHTVLGRVALAHGDRETACRELLLAGATPGSPVLNSFGPDMTLARGLLFAGESETVLKYFDQCLRFWKFGEEPIRRWKWMIRYHLPPNFGNNLVRV